jgi:hypothetical protein
MEQSEHMQHFSVKFAVLYGLGSCAPKQSKITDLQITITYIIILKSLKYCENYQNVSQRHEVSTCCWKNCVDKLAWRRDATNLQFVKKKTQYPQSAIKRSTKKRGMPVITSWSRILFEKLVVAQFINKFSVTSICNIYSLKMQTFSLFHTVVSTLHVSAIHRHPQVRLRWLLHCSCS